MVESSSALDIPSPPMSIVDCVASGTVSSSCAGVGDKVVGAAMGPGSVVSVTAVGWLLLLVVDALRLSVGRSWLGSYGASVAVLTDAVE